MSGQDGDEDNHANEQPEETHNYESPGTSSKTRRRRPSLNNPKIKPRQAQDDTSTLQLLAKENEERRQKKEESGDPANAMLAPKNDYIFILLQQHLLSAGYDKTAKLIKEESSKNASHKVDRFVLPKTKSLKNTFIEALKIGNEKAFFEARHHLHADLNYYQLNFPLSLELEMKTRVYFALYYLINLERLKITSEEGKKRTAERMEALKAFFVEKGSHFGDDTDLKEYLKVPYLVESMPADNQMLNFVLSADFFAQIMEENVKEIERVIFFATEATRHRSFVTKIYEYYIKYHPTASNSQLTEGIYQQVEAAIAHVTEQSAKFKSDAEELDRLHEKLTELIETTRSRFQFLLDEEKAKSKKIVEGTIEPVRVVQVNRECRAANEKFSRRLEEVKRLTTEFEEVTAYLKKVSDGYNPDELAPEDQKVQVTFYEKKQRLLLLKLKLISIEMKKPVVDV